jgi:hypothetical protein
MMMLSNLLELLRRNLIVTRIKSIGKRPELICTESDNWFPYYLLLVLTIKDEAQYVREWIEYHRVIGVDHFVIYDNGSSDNLKTVLADYINQGIVFYHYIPGANMQIKSYNDSIVRYKNIARWMGFIDSDEFINIKNGCNIADFLKQYEAYPGIGINWIMFDSNGNDCKPESGFVITNYTRTYQNHDEPINRHIKSIVNPRMVKKCINQHFCLFYGNKRTVDENYQAVKLAWTERNTSDKIQINHYWTKSKEEYLFKINKRGRPYGAKRAYDEKSVNFPFYTNVSDPNIDRIANILKEKIPETYCSGNK